MNIPDLSTAEAGSDEVSPLASIWPEGWAPQMPTDEELHTSNLAYYNSVAHTFIDNWPDEIRALSMPTKMVQIDASLMLRLWGNKRDDHSAAEEIAATLDAEMGWAPWLVRLNSRSPKDMSYPVAPITCSGKQAVWWIGGSERCLDDASMLYHAHKPLYICLRQYVHMYEDAEFRCFAKGGKLLGVSRYFFDKEPEDTMNDGRLWDGAEAYYETHLAKHYPDIVFDLHAPGFDNALLIEINPYGLSNPCCFDSYADIEENGGVRQSRALQAAVGE